MKQINYNQHKSMYRKLIFSALILTGIFATLPAQEVQRTQPKIWLGVSGAANLNRYTGTTQTLNASLMVPAAFHNGSGIGGFGSLLLEYRPIQFFGFLLNLGYDNRSGAFEQEVSPCNCPEDLKTDLSYATIQPSIRISPFGPDFYMFLGGAYSLNLTKSFAYTFDQNNGNLFNTYQGEFSNIRSNVFSTHIGLGYDIQLAAANSRNQVALSPFISYHPYFGQAPRDIESWSLSTTRVGLALKFGAGKVQESANDDSETALVQKKTEIIEAEKKTEIVPATVVKENPVVKENSIIKDQKENPAAIVASNKKADFIVRAPISVPVKRTINESFPLRNYIFFEKGSSEIPKRYIKLTPTQASNFKLEQLRESDPKDQSGRSARQMKAYYNILNILGYRMIENPTVNITLTGASAGDGEALGKTYAESVKLYLVNVFGIKESRITTAGRNQPINPSELPGGKSFLVMLREGDRRVDIESSQAYLLAPLQLIVVQADPLDSRILFNVKSDEPVPFKTWNVAVTDENGITRNYGPYTRNQESISGNTILGNNAKGKYKFVVIGQMSDGRVIRKESEINLVRNVEPKEVALRFSILFGFDQSNAVADYEKFLIDEVAPHIVNNGTVIIHGHTDIIGTTEYNMQLSERRAVDVRQILEKAVLAAGKTGVRFDVFAFGSDTENAPFENKLPEERFYNRTVIIDIVQPQQASL